MIIEFNIDIQDLQFEDDLFKRVYNDREHDIPLSLYKTFLNYNISMTFLQKLSSKIVQLNEQEQSKHLKWILLNLSPRHEYHNFDPAFDVTIPTVAEFGWYVNHHFDMHLSNFTTKTSRSTQNNRSTAVIQPSNTEITKYNNNIHESKYGSVYTFKTFDNCRYNFHIIQPYNIIDMKNSDFEIHLPNPPRVCIVNKNNLIGDSLNDALVSQINKLRQNCDDFEEKPSTSTTMSSMIGWVKNTSIKKQHIIDPLLNTNKYLIPTLFYVDKSANRCDILGEINNCPRLYNLYLYDLIGAIFFKFIPTIEYMLNLNNLDKKIIQVIVSCHDKILPPNTYYFGNLHREGYIDGESIQIGCIYYFDKSKCLDNSDDILEIQSSFQWYGLGYEKFRINIDKKDCIVFNNTIMNHKVYKLCNNSNETGQRSLMTFWLPKFKINSSSDIDVLYKYKNTKYHLVKVFIIIQNWVRKFNHHRKLELGYNTVLCKNIENLINKYIISPKTMHHSNYSSIENTRNMDMNQLRHKRCALRKDRTDTKMRNCQAPMMYS